MDKCLRRSLNVHVRGVNDQCRMGRIMNTYFLDSGLGKNVYLKELRADLSGVEMLALPCVSWACAVVR